MDQDDWPTTGDTYHCPRCDRHYAVLGPITVGHTRQVLVAVKDLSTGELAAVTLGDFRGEVKFVRKIGGERVEQVVPRFTRVEPAAAAGKVAGTSTQGSGA